jgi:hypothetical protein
MTRVVFTKKGVQLNGGGREEHAIMDQIFIKECGSYFYRHVNGDRRGNLLCKNDEDGINAQCGYSLYYRPGPLYWLENSFKSGKLTTNIPFYQPFCLLFIYFGKSSNIALYGICS